jgi:PncC family amidohydrolase
MESVNTRDRAFLFAADEELENPVALVAEALTTLELTIAVAESCTAGLLGGALTEASGASSYFFGGVIAYDNDVKVAQLGVDPGLIEQHGAVSAQVACAMAAGVRNLIKTNIGLAVTGIAGPTGGTREKPVGTTFVALAASDAQITRALRFEGDRAANRADSVHAALTLLADYLQDTLRRRADPTAQ